MEKEAITPGWFWCFDCDDSFYNGKYHVESPPCEYCGSHNTESDKDEGEDD
jgi:Zn finger protein HypA/HybF involved in hydrogenase expression